MKWTESIVINRPKARVYPAVLDQNTLMEWSAWPAATGCSCQVQGDDTSPGSQIFFTDNDGKEQFARIWLSRRIRPLHVKDLQQLKDLVERGADV